MGRTQVDQDEVVGYEIQAKYYNPEYHWSIRGSNRVEVIEEKENGKIALVKIHAGAIGGFQVVYGDKNSGYHFSVSINRLCHKIKGPDKVYSFDRVYYTIDDNQGNWYVSPGDIAKIIEETDEGIKVEVLATKRSEFQVEHLSLNGETDVLSVEVRTP